MNRFGFLLGSLLAFTSLPMMAQMDASIKLNEVMTLNESSLIDEYGARNAWVEISNISHSTYNIRGMYLTTDRSVLDKKMSVPERVSRMSQIPNGDVRTVICRSRGQQVAQVNVTIAHGQDLYRAKEVIEDECRQIAERLSLDSVPVVYPAIANDARCVTMRVEYPCDVNRDWPLEREIRLSVYDRLRREDIKP